MGYRIVLIVALVEAAILAILIAIHLGRAVWMARVRPARDQRYREARKVLSHFIASGAQNLDRERLGVLQSLSRGQQFSLFAQVASILSASDRRFATGVAKRIGLLEAAESMSRSRLWWRRLHAVRFLSSLGETWLTPNRFLKDRRLEVRAQAAEWAGDLGNPRWIPDLLEQLGDPSGLSRYTVQDALQRIGSPVVEPLTLYLSRDRSERELVAALVVAEKIADGRLLDAMLRLSRHESVAVRVLAARTLAAIGGDAASTRLKEVASDPDGDVRTAAIRGIASIGGIEAAGWIAKFLSDSSWNVRREAGLSLARMGAPGRILLRNQTQSEDRFARDMATLVLDLPSGGERP